MKKLVNSNERGITLLALVITIAILIILSTITINMAFGDHGLVGQAQYARDLTANSTYAEADQTNKLLAEFTNIMAEEGTLSNP